MKRRRLGRLEVGAIGLGCMSMTPIYGEPSEPEAIATIQRAVERVADHRDRRLVVGLAVNARHRHAAEPQRRHRQPAQFTLFQRGHSFAPSCVAPTM